MVTPKNIQLHYMHPFSAVGLNSGDDGLPKRLLFGDEIRTRTSSQCLKRHWAMYDGPHSIYRVPGAEKDIRSREIISGMVMPEVRERGRFQDELIEAVEEQMNIGLYGSKDAGDRHNRQSLLLGLPEIEFLQDRAEEICREHQDSPDDAREAVKEMFQWERANFIALRDSGRVSHGLRAAL